ncbi:MAG TPA: hypothetical protein PKC43_06965 [Phycisphaerales bacterium]|nr:hypothetical protein [Phycisphaerales bacterium]HMP37174.1 hypothetical protein [Phycisphaerales bacterium]
MRSVERDHPTLPRGLIFLASFWLVGAWQLSMGGISPIQPSSTVYAPGVRMMLQALALGALVGWPLLRLSQPPCSWSLRRAAIDLAALSALAQLVLWPLRLVTPWSVERLLAVDLLLAASATTVGAVVATASRPGSNRTAGMACVLALLLAGPLAATALPAGAGPGAEEGALRSALLASSPFVALHAFAEPGAGPLSSAERTALAAPIAAAIGAWIGAWMVIRRIDARRSRPRANDGPPSTPPRGGSPAGRGGAGGGGDGRAVPVS